MSSTLNSKSMPKQILDSITEYYYTSDQKVPRSLYHPFNILSSVHVLPKLERDRLCQIRV